MSRQTRENGQESINENYDVQDINQLRDWFRGKHSMEPRLVRRDHMEDLTLN